MPLLAHNTAARLRDHDHPLPECPALVGFDGFIDTICHVVDQRQSATAYSRVRTLRDYGNRIVAAAGHSTNVEIVRQSVKLGGNGPILANAMCALGVPMTYCGMIGYPHPHQVFGELGERARLLPMADPGLTDAFEFDDGKLIVGVHETVAEVSYETLVQRVGIAAWREAWRDARFVAMVNWTMLPFLSQLWDKLLDDLSSEPPGPRKLLFFDLADPEKRARAELSGALGLIARFQTRHDVMLGLNAKEAHQVAQVLGLEERGSGGEAARTAAVGIREHLGISLCVVHLTDCAAAADAHHSALVAGPFTATPKISTGAGDHFNAGFCVGRLLDFDLQECLQMGVGTSGYYVRTAQSPDNSQLATFLETL